MSSRNKPFEQGCFEMCPCDIEEIHGHISFFEKSECLGTLPPIFSKKRGLAIIQSALLAQEMTRKCGENILREIIESNLPEEETEMDRKIGIMLGFLGIFSSLMDLFQDKEENKKDFSMYN